MVSPYPLEIQFSCCCLFPFPPPFSFYTVCACYLGAITPSLPPFPVIQKRTFFVVLIFFCNEWSGVEDVTRHADLADMSLYCMSFFSFPPSYQSGLKSPPETLPQGWKDLSGNFCCPSFWHVGTCFGHIFTPHVLIGVCVSFFHVFLHPRSRLIPLDSGDLGQRVWVFFIVFLSSF